MPDDNRRRPDPRSRRPPPRPGVRLPPTGIGADIKALDSSIKLLSQKVMYLVKNQNILSRNLIVVNKKITNLQKMSQEKGSGSGELSKEVMGEINSLNLRIDVLEQKINEIKMNVENVENIYAAKSDLSEIKYVIDTINPVELVTQQQLKDALSGKENSQNAFETLKKEIKVETKKEIKADEKKEKKKQEKKKEKDIWAEFGV